jgi:hypothetical protein
VFRSFQKHRLQRERLGLQAVAGKQGYVGGLAGEEEQQRGAVLACKIESNKH